MAVNRNAYAYKKEYSYIDEPRMELLPQSQARKGIASQDKIIAGFTIVIVFVTAFIYIFLQSQIGAAAYEVRQLQNQIQEVEMLSQRLDLEVGNLSSLERIEKYVRENLGMVYSELDNVAYLGEESSESIALALAGLSSVANENPSIEETSGEYSLWSAWATMFADYFARPASAEK